MSVPRARTLKVESISLDQLLAVAGAEATPLAPEEITQAIAHHPRIGEKPVILTDVAAHYHVPLLLGPFAYSTYRGS